MNVRPSNILLVEDSQADIRLLQEALAEARVANTLYVVRDGEEAMAWLRKEAPHQHTPRPDLVLLDLNLPKKDGREVLREVKQDENLRRIPVVIMTSSEAETDVVRSYDLHANAYVQKPLNLERLHAIMSTLEEFWFVVAKLPPT